MGLIKDLHISLPPLSQQKKFVTMLQNIKSQAENYGESLSEQLFQSLLQKAFTGELVS